MSPTLELDYSANAAYLRLRDGDIVETCEVTDQVLVDLDEQLVVVGVEVLTLDAHIPYEKLTRDYHVTTSDLAILDSIRPSVTSFVQRQSSPLSVAAPQDALETCA